MIQRGLVDEAAAVDIEIEHRDGSRESKSFAPGDRIVFTLNDARLGVANGSLGTVKGLLSDPVHGALLLSVELDDPNPNGDRVVAIPPRLPVLTTPTASRITKARAAPLTPPMST